LASATLNAPLARWSPSTAVFIAPTSKNADGATHGGPAKTYPRARRSADGRLLNRAKGRSWRTAPLSREQVRSLSVARLRKPDQYRCQTIVWLPRSHRKRVYGRSSESTLIGCATACTGACLAVAGLTRESRPVGLGLMGTAPVAPKATKARRAKEELPGRDESRAKERAKLRRELETAKEEERTQRRAVETAEQEVEQARREVERVQARLGTAEAELNGGVPCQDKHRAAGVLERLRLLRPQFRDLEEQLARAPWSAKQASLTEMLDAYAALTTALRARNAH
jgi:hypothetical protein